MAFNFPDAPVVGQLYPDPAVVGVPQYQWDGTAWMVAPASSLFVAKAGDTMTGNLTVAPAAGNGSVTIAPVAGSANLIVDAPTLADSANIFGRVAGNLKWRFVMAAGAGSDFSILPYDDAVVAQPAALIGTRSTGLLTVRANPTANLGIATKQYVDSVAGGAGIPAGTTMLFRQTAAPTGWVKETVNYNDHAIRVTTGTVTNGGSIPFSTLFSRIAVDALTLTNGEMPYHQHQPTQRSGTGGTQTGDGFLNGSYDTSSGSWTGPSGGSNYHQHSIDMRMRYVDVIFATKS